MESTPPVREFYNGYAPPIDVLRTVRALLNSIPEKHVRGLDSIILTNQSGKPRRQRLGKVSSRGRKFSQTDVLGFYHPGCTGRRPWIELHVDNIITSHANPLSAKNPYYSYEVAFGVTLFHEIGHHIHKTMAAEFRDQEDVADDWAAKLLADYLRKSYGYVIPVKPE